MKIGVVTPYDSSNFGAFLQAYCLKRTIEKMGHEVIHIRNRSDEEAKKLYYHEMPIGRKEKIMPWKYQKDKHFGEEKYNIFREAQAVFNVKTVNESEADLFILGSDEIWNINHKAFRNTHFWGKEMNPVISYAPSIGNADIEEYGKYPEIVNCLNNLNLALVRDEKTKTMVESYSNTKVHTVCDPTMLLPVDEYYEHVEDEYIKTHDCLLVYAYKTIKKNEIKSIRETAKKLNLKTVACCFNHSWCDYQIQCSPLQFSSLIRQCKAVVTTTFHGTMFCLLNHANFASITVSVKTTQLLEMCNLKSKGLRRDDVSTDNLTSCLTEETHDMNQVDFIIENLRKKSIKLLEEAINKSDKENDIYDYQICEYKDCTGCFACMNKCPKGAIKCVVDKEGKTVPLIDAKKCIKCGLCRKVCPINYPIKKNVPKECFAAQIPDIENRKKSASGGIAAVLAELFIKQDGVVYGSSVQSGGKIEHIRATSEMEIQKFRGSKYVQSYVGNSYSNVKKDLDSGKKVLFTGTPCQIAGLKKYLGENECFENLLCVDIICHGVPPYQYLRQHINTIDSNGDARNITFRGGNLDFHLVLYDSDEKIIYDKDQYHDEYYYSFMKSYIYRRNCYECQYAVESRVSDITIGDFWGIDRDTLQTNMQGRISVVLINTEKGKKIFNEIKQNLTCEQRDLQEAVDGNPQLRRPAIKNKEYENFIQAYLKTSNFDKAIKATSVKKQIYIYDFKSNKVYSALRNIKKKFTREDC